MDIEFSTDKLGDGTVHEGRRRKASSVYTDFVTGSGIEKFPIEKHSKRTKYIPTKRLSKESNYVTDNSSEVHAAPKTALTKLSIKQKQDDALEEIFMETYLSAESQLRIIKVPSVTVETKDFDDQLSAVKYSVKECSTMLLDWTSTEAHRIGAQCKVFWDGECEWFYARILNYDRIQKRHFVRFKF